MIHTLSVVTNAIVMCFEVVTTQSVPVSCPDGIAGCCVAHYQNVTTKSYIPCTHLMDTNRINCGIAILPKRREELYSRCVQFDTPEMTPVGAADESGHIRLRDGRPEIIGWLYRNKLLDSLDIWVENPAIPFPFQAQTTNQGEN